LAAIATQLLVFTQDIYLFCALVVVSGAAQAPIWPACIKALSNNIDENSLGTYVGLLGSAPYAGASFSSAFIVYTADRYGWRHSMMPIFVICALVTLFVFYFLHQNTDQQAKRSKRDHSYITLAHF
jgi:sugar phosphate permease